MMNYDLSEINQALKTALDTKNKAQEARGEFERKILVNKINEKREQELYKWKGEQDLANKKVEKTLMSPLEEEQFSQYKKSPESYDISSGSPKPLGLKERAEKVYMKPKEQWTEDDQRTIKNYQVFAGSQRSNIAGQLRKEFIDRPETKEYINIDTQIRSMDSLLKRAKDGNIQNKVSLDQGLITLFNKLTDPQSVVRESEYARTPQNLPLANRFNGALEKLQKGGAGLTNSDREALVWGAKVIGDERGKTYTDTLNSYKDLADQYDISPDLVIRGMAEHKPYMQNEEAPVSKQYAIGDIIPSGGKQYRVTGGDPRDPDVEEVTE